MTNSSLVVVSIDYDQPRNEAPAGETISGQVVLQVSKTIAIRGVRIYFHGIGKACWSSFGKLDSSREVYLSEAKEILQSRHNVYNALMLQPGVHCYPFGLRLPADLPASYRDPSNHVRYKSKVTVEGQRREDKFTAEKAFLVSRPLDLNLEPARLKRVVRVRREVFHSSGCFISGTVNVDFTINRRCFVPSEDIILSGVIVNSTDRTIHRTTIAIVQEVTLHKSRVKRVLKKIVSKVDGPKVPPYQEKDWSEVKLPVPHVPLSRLDGCNILSVDYSIQFSVAFRFPCSESTKSLKTIVIGDVHLQLPVESSIPSRDTSTSPSRDSSTSSTSSSSSRDSSPPQTERNVQRTPPFPSETWGTQWNMVNWMNPLVKHRVVNLPPTSTDIPNTGNECSATFYRNPKDALKPNQSTQEFTERQQIRDSDILLNDYI